jgi:2,3-bisphosphoglycerate-independent phosphoglycerate mutase
MSKRTLLMILDGWGLGNGDKADIISNTPTPNVDKLMKEYPNNSLIASGMSVGLPEGQMGNSEVGHLNIGAGRIVYQDLVKINLAVEDGSIAKNTVLQNAFIYAKKENKSVHFLGLLSDGGVHSMNTHLHKLCDLTEVYNLDKVYIHALTDGRDTDPQSAYSYVEELLNHIENSKVKIASLIGRYYTMDRDKRWERIKTGYDLMLNAIGEKSKNLLQTIKNSYKNGVTDEFIKPVIMVDDNDKPVATIKEGDVVICFNFRTDRLRQITTVLTQKNMPEYAMQTIPLHYVTMTRYDEAFKGVEVVYDKNNVNMTIGEVISLAGKKQIRIAETEKYAHVTYFFSGGREEKFDGEKRILIQSPKVATYDLKPEMSAYEVKDAIISELNQKETDFICLNFANGDMVGHTGIYDAIQKAVATVDRCVGEVVEVARANDYEVVIIADHGNADFAVNADGSPNTAHSLNPVPIIIVSDRYKSVKSGVLADVAPTILYMMDIEIPDVMTGKILIE